eukprot:TRINITY_DN11831_c0_g2_i1.p1 TRINITY_DN11831_c0_g2~~TRINITY_DN11831_c0_g2_i1.p1  ORF type:complete len:1195 (-),score=153.11 TRINITY_DN11831_c0_g2_i1:119-3703(-)
MTTADPVHTFDPSLAQLCFVGGLIFAVVSWFHKYEASAEPLVNERGAENESSVAPRAVSSPWKPSDTEGQYLRFLMCLRNLFFCLSLVTFVWIGASWGPECFIFFVPRGCGFHVAITAKLDAHGFVMVCAMTAFQGLIAVYFVARFHLDTSRRRPVETLEKHALWLSKIPVQDQATLKPHELSKSEFENIVEKDLELALQEYIRDNFREQDPWQRCSSVNASGRSSMACPLGDCPCKCCCCECNLACLMLCGCCPHGHREEPAVSSPSGANRRCPASEFSHLHEIIVQPVMNKYSTFIDLYHSIKDAYDWKEFFRQKLEICKANQVSATFWMCKWYRRLQVMWHAQRHKNWERIYEKLVIKFESSSLEEERMKMSGDAFVIFSNEEHRDFMLAPRRKWWEIRDHTYFRFGRPPFSSVTLECRSAPNPRDILWQNLHVGLCPDRLFPIVMLMLVVVHSICFVFALSFASQFFRLRRCASASENPYSKLWVWLCKVAVWCDTYFNTRHLPSLTLMLFTTWLLPLLTRWISCRMFLHQQTVRMNFEFTLNINLLLLSVVVVPFMSLVVAGSIVELAYTAEFNMSKLPEILGWPQDAISDMGMFSLKYTLTCAFVGNALTLLQFRRHSMSRIAQWGWAWTETEKTKALQPPKFDWGYSYAWAIIMACNGLVMGVVVPSMLPVTAIMFWIKLFVDKKLFEGRAYELGVENSWIYPPNVSYHMYLVIAAKMLFMGIGCLMCAVWKGDEESWFDLHHIRYYTGICLLILMSLILWVSVRVSRLQQNIVNETPESDDTCLQKFGYQIVRCVDYLLMSSSMTGRSQVRHSVRRGQTQQPLLGQDTDERSEAQEEGMARASVNDTLLERRESVPLDLTWDARVNIVKELFANEPGHILNTRLRARLCHLLGLEHCVNGYRRIRSQSFNRARHISDLSEYTAVLLTRSDRQDSSLWEMLPPPGVHLMRSRSDSLRHGLGSPRMSGAVVANAHELQQTVDLPAASRKSLLGLPPIIMVPPEQHAAVLSAASPASTPKATMPVTPSAANSASNAQTTLFASRHMQPQKTGMVEVEPPPSMSRSTTPLPQVASNEFVAAVASSTSTAASDDVAKCLSHRTCSGSASVAVEASVPPRLDSISRTAPTPAEGSPGVSAEGAAITRSPFCETEWKSPSSEVASVIDSSGMSPSVSSISSWQHSPRQPSSAS